MKLNWSLLLCTCLLFSFTGLHAQNNVGIGVESPDPSALLHLNSNGQGLLVPRMDSTSRKAISGPADGLMVFDTSVNCFYYYSTSTNGGWTSLCPGGSANPYNQSINYNTQTDSLTITDGAGTKSTYITPPMRAEKQLTIDVSIPAQGTPTGTTYFDTMPTMKLTFTPNGSMVFIMLTASGIGTLDTTEAQQMYIAIRDSSVRLANPPIVAGGTLCDALFPSDPTPNAVNAWNISLCAPYGGLTPGVPVTLQVYWWFSTANNSTSIVGSIPAGSGANLYHCNLLVWE